MVSQSGSPATLKINTQNENFKATLASLKRPNNSASPHVTSKPQVKKNPNVENPTTSLAGVVSGYLDRCENSENKDPYAEAIAKVGYNAISDAKDKKKNLL